MKFVYQRAKSLEFESQTFSERIEENDVIKEIELMNCDPKETEMKLITVIKRQKHSNESSDILVEVDAST